MKKIIKSNAIGLLPFLFVLILSIYFIAIVLKYPLVGMEVKEKDNHWIVEKIYENGWASRQSIDEGDILQLIDGRKPVQHSTVLFFNRIEMANYLTILDKNSKIKIFTISYGNFDKQYVIYLLLPILFNITTLSLSIFLYRRNKNDKSAKILIYFLLSIGICYLSASGSARGEIIGRVFNTITLPGSLILFVHFLESYLLRFDIVFIKAKSLKRLYTLYFVVLSIIASSFIIYKHNSHIEIFQLIYFLLLIFYLLFQLIRVYLKYKNSEGNNVLKILWITLFLAFSPFVCLYAIPNILFKQEFVSAELTAIFLVVIPISFVYLQLAEKLFDMDFILNRLRYFSLLSLPFSFFTVLLLILELNIAPFSIKTAFIFLLVFSCAILFLYIKEYLDYKIRQHLFSQKSNFESSLYTFFQRAKFETKVNSLITNLINEIKDVLIVKKVIYIEINTKNDSENWLLRNRENFPPSFVEGIEKIKWNNYRIGTLKEILDGFGIVIGGDSNLKNVIFFGMKRTKINLNIQERIWLETLAYFSSILLENFQLIEGLFEKIENYKEKKEMEIGNYPNWFSRLMFSLSEKERANLSIDLHDSVLQEQLQLLREIERIKGKVSDDSIKNDLLELKERMLDNIHLIRETCNELRPPFLSELGIIQSIQNLIEQTKLRCNFLLKSELDQSIQMLDKEYELTLYRVVQELLNNAMKHSLASEVLVSINRNNQKINLTYRDNGKGIDMLQLNDSFKTMGIFGMKERVKSIGGTIEIKSAPGIGTQVIIEIKTGGNDND